MYFSGTGNVSSFGTKSWTRGSLWRRWSPWIDHFSVTCGFCRLRLSRFTMKFSAKTFAPYGCFPPQSGFSEFGISSWQFCCTICKWEYESIIFLSDQYFFRDDSPSPRIGVWCLQFVQIFSQLMNSCLTSWWNRMMLQKGVIGPFSGSPNRLSNGVFPSARRSWTFHR